MFNWFNKDKNKKEKKQKEVEKGEIIEEFKNKNVGIILSGGNVDVTNLPF